MTTDQKREAIRVKVIEAIPEVVELKFGCRILVDGVKEIETIYKIMEDDDGKKIYFPTGWIHGSFYREQFQVIGRPITALDILRAIKICDKSHDSFFQMFFTAYKDELAIKYGMDQKTLHLDLSKVLTNFDELTIDKLYELFYE